MVTLDENTAGGFSVAEMNEVVSRYPCLHVIRPDCLEGVLDLHAHFNGHLIEDAFEVRIIASPQHPTRMPTLTEIGGRTEAILAKYRLKDPRSLHRNPNAEGTACVCVPQMERKQFPPGSRLIVFVENLAVPYLYGISHYDAVGTWPWGEHSHGALGVLEYYSESADVPTEEEIQQVAALIRPDKRWKQYYKQVRKPSGDRFCLCGSRKPFARCHPSAWRGVARLNTHLKTLGRKTL